MPLDYIIDDEKTYKTDKINHDEMDLILPSTFGEIHTNLCPFSSMINLLLNLDILFVFVDIRRHIFNISNGNNNYY